MSQTPLASTQTLLFQYREGDARARDTLLERYLPVLQRWARGRLPARGRDLAETDDLVQMTFMRVLGRLESFDAQHPGAFLAYLRRILLNAVRDELSDAKSSPDKLELDEGLHSDGRSPVEMAVEADTLKRYENALACLPDLQQAAVILRVEFGMSFPEIATELGCASANAARMMVTRALTQLAERMK
jgi:RNA polymerase sigma factor (sigma-70 family)